MHTLGPAKHASGRAANAADPNLQELGCGLSGESKQKAPERRGLLALELEAGDLLPRLAADIVHLPTGSEDL